MIILEYILFLLISVFSFYVPGRLFIDLLKLSLKPFDDFIVSWFMGISLFILGTYSFAWIRMPQIYLFLLIVLNIYAFLNRRKTLFKFEKLDLFSLIIIAAGSLSFLYVMYFSGFITNAGMQFLGVNSQDGIRHIAYIKNQVFTFPPQNPGLYGTDLKGFHYFYDFLLAKFSQFYFFSAEDLYFRLFPLLISVLYGLAFYFLSRKITGDVIARRLIIFFAYFARSFSVILFLFNTKIDMSESPIVHSTGLILNPFIVLAIGMLIAGIAFLPEIKKSLKYAVIVGLIFGVLSQIKVYAGIIAIGIICIFSLYIFFRFRKKYIFNYLILLFITAIITAITFLPNNFKQGGLIFDPLEFYRHYISGNFFDNLQWDLRRMTFEQEHNYLMVAILYIAAVVLFWIYNLGILMVIAAKAKSLIKKSFWLNEFSLILFFAVAIPVIIASLFIQSVSVFDTVQFLWIVIPLLGIPAGIIFAGYIKHNKFIGLSIILLILLFSVPGYLNSISDYNPFKPTLVINNNDLKFYKIIEKTVPENSFLIYIPNHLINRDGTKFYQTNSLIIEALSGRQTYLDGGNLPNNLEKLSAQRFNNLSILSNAIITSNSKSIIEELNKIGSAYILTRKAYSIFSGKTNIPEANSGKYNLYIY